MQQNYYIIKNGTSPLLNSEFETKRDAILRCMKEVELDCKVGARGDYYEVYNMLDIDRKVLYTTKGVIYKFMREKHPELYPPKVQKAQTTIFNNVNRCDLCTRFTNGKGSDKLCAYHWEKVIGNATDESIKSVINKIKIDIANALSNAIK